MKNKRELEAGGLENGEIIIFNDIPSEWEYKPDVLQGMEHTKKPYIVLKGGRNSFKSSVIALLLVFKMAQSNTKRAKK